MWKKILAMVIGVLIGYWLIDDFNPGKLIHHMIFILIQVRNSLTANYSRLTPDRINVR